MGKEIVYCGDCGKSIREEEFDKGRAQTIENRPFCAECRPVPKTPPPLKSSSTRLPLASPPPSTRRLRAHLATRGSRMPWIAGACLAGAALLVLIVMLASGEGGRPEIPETPTPAPTAERATAALRDLEAFASSSTDPEAILKRCDAARAAIHGSSLEPRLRAVEERAKERLFVKDRDQKLNVALESIRQIRSVDPKFDRHEEVERLIKAALDMAGPRKGEVENLKEQYKREHAAFLATPPPPPAPALPPTPPPPTPNLPASELGPFELGAASSINHWLVIGPFGNRKDLEGLYDNYLPAPEADYAASPGQEVRTKEGSTLKWRPATASDGKFSFYAIDSFGLASRTQEPAIAYAACWMELEDETDLKFRAHAEIGFELWVDHQRIGHRKKGAGFADPEEVFRTKLAKGAHPVLLKVATTGGAFGFALRAASPIGERLKGVRIWNRAPAAGKVIFAEDFNQGAGKFAGGEIVEGGPDGSKALCLPKKGAAVEGVFSGPITSTTILRFKIKPLFAITTMEVIFWVPKNGNHWYHLRSLKPNEWNAAEFRLAEARGGWKMDGPSLEGEVPPFLKFYFDDGGPEARVLIDDVEIVDVP